MNRTIFVVMALLGAVPCSALTVRDLRETAAVVASFSPDRLNEPMDLKELQKVITFTGYYEGFMDGLDQAAVSFEWPDLEHVPLTYEKADWMDNKATAAASILAFMALHEPQNYDRRDSSAHRILSAWFLWNCKNPTPLGKFSALSILQDVYGKVFPGSDAMLREISPGIGEYISRQRAQKSPDPTEVADDSGEAEVDPRKARDEAEKSLQNVYDETLLLYEDEPKVVDALRTAQKAWVGFRDAHMKAIWPAGGTYGTVAGTVVSMEQKKLADQRRAELLTWHDGLEEGDLSSGCRKSKAEMTRRLAKLQKPSGSSK